MPLQPPATTDHRVTIRKFGAVAIPTTAKQSASGPSSRNGRRPQRSDKAPASIAEIAQETEVADTRLATRGMLVDKSLAISSRNGARVVPLLEAANIANAPVASIAHGMGGARGTRIEAAAVWMRAVTRSAAAMR